MPRKKAAKAKDDDDPPNFVRWVDEHTDALGVMFGEGSLDPQLLDNDSIDKIWEVFQKDNDSIFKGCPKLRFRHHHKEKAAVWMAGEAARGRRRRTLFVLC